MPDTPQDVHGGATTARSVNRLGAAWAGRLDTPPGGQDGTVFAPVGVWPLLGLLAVGAEPQVAAELEEAVGLPAGRAASAARVLIEALEKRDGMSAALGLWTAGSVGLDADWLSALPAGTHGELTGDSAADKARLDGWARDRTDGQIPAMPVRLDPTTLLVLASAFTARDDWAQRFTERPLRPGSGPWSGRERPGLHRDSALDDDSVGVLVPDSTDLDTGTDAGAGTGTSAGAGAPVTEVRIAGERTLDVHLLLGAEDAAPAQVLRTGIAALETAGGRAAGVRRIGAEDLTEETAGPGMTVGTTTTTDRLARPRLDLSTVPFEVSATHDLLRLAEVFGLATAADSGRNRFPGVSTDTPLAVQSAGQSATAEFSATGFRTAAVTAIGMMRAAAVLQTPPEQRVRQVAVRFERPFGFLALLRPERGEGAEEGPPLLLSAGWVGSPSD
ncbi:serpin family protein [Phaeacidiphilus oryzae]|uniref:serpin family protein n=1 Tax=Phaeacidiphilus oryzae TaxID=348818 RepID=UPI00068B059C|nr:serpin family protein [Phaeacidiphilus oryzae]